MNYNSKKTRINIAPQGVRHVRLNNSNDSEKTKTVYLTIGGPIFQAQRHNLKAAPHSRLIVQSKYKPTNVIKEDVRTLKCGFA